VRLFAWRAADPAGGEGKAMTRESERLGKFGSFGRGQLATQVAVLLPVVVLAGLSAWTMGAKGQSTQVATMQSTLAPDSAPTAAKPDPAAVPDAVTLNGLTISSQSWRRGGLGSNALFNFTVRNTNDYAVGDIEVACTFTRRDGSPLTERKRVIPDGVVDMKSRKTFARVHIAFVNINANKAKCALVAASRI
jgi:hypothetical protein